VQHRLDLPLDCRARDPRGGQPGRRRRTGKSDGGGRPGRRPVTALRARVASRRRASAWSPATRRPPRASETMASPGCTPTQPVESEHRPRQAPPPCCRRFQRFHDRRDAVPFSARHDIAVYPHRASARRTQRARNGHAATMAWLHPATRYTPCWSCSRCLVRGDVARRQGNWPGRARARGTASGRGVTEGTRGIGTVVSARRERATRETETEREREREKGRKNGGAYEGTRSLRGGGAEIVRQGSPHAGRQTLVVNRAPRTAAAATRHCTPVSVVGHVLLSHLSPPTYAAAYSAAGLV